MRASAVWILIIFAITIEASKRPSSYRNPPNGLRRVLFLSAIYTTIGVTAILIYFKAETILGWDP